MTVHRRALLLAAAAGVMPLQAHAARGEGLPLAVALQREIAASVQRRKALVVMVSLHGCPFCKVVRDSHLAPLLRDEGQPVVQVDMGSAAVLFDAVGRPTTHAAQVTAWQVRVAPTVLFLGIGGREVAPRLEGAGIPDFYGAYLEQRLAAANRTVGG